MSRHQEKRASQSGEGEREREWEMGTFLIDAWRVYLALVTLGHSHVHFSVHLFVSPFKTDQPKTWPCVGCPLK